MTCGGSFPPDRFAALPVASIASSTASRGTADASTPSEIQSVRRPAQEAAARKARADQIPIVARPSVATNPDTPDKYSQLLRQLVRVHEAFRYDALPPWTDSDTWWYRFEVCGDKLTGAELKASPVTHIVCTYERGDTGRYVEVYRRYGISTTAEP